MTIECEVVTIVATHTLSFILGAVFGLVISYAMLKVYEG